MINIYKKILKRIIDIVFSTIAIIVTSPIMIILSIIIYLKLGNPIFFTQNRLGKDGKVFKIIKFRTMSNSKDKHGALLDDSKRVTKLGQFVRSTSLDELPELINVLKGDMSIVGPRPLLEEYKDFYSGEEYRRHEVTPGITGLAQVSGRNSLKWDERFKLDVYYVDNLNPILDIKILIITVFKVLKREDINEIGNVGMTKFKGTQRVEEA